MKFGVYTQLKPSQKSYSQFPTVVSNSVIDTRTYVRKIHAMTLLAMIDGDDR
jgi:hypothetical protein